MLRDIKGTQRLPRLLAIKLDGTGTAAIGEGATDATLVDNNTGDYTLTFAKPFARTPVVVANSLTAAVNIKLHAISNTAVNILTFAVDGTTAKDADLDILVLGWDAEDRN